ncbi:MAG: hypothetical protein K6B43_02490 [Treponema sp.]|nr:hypothetical protein [Treponema sp.]
MLCEANTASLHSGLRMSCVKTVGTFVCTKTLFRASCFQFSDRNVWPAKLEVGKQQKHIKGHRNFIPGKSILPVPLEKAAELLDRYSGNGVVVGNPETSNKEWVNFRTVIGESFNGGRSEGMTPKGMIHHSKKGCHIVPSSPKGDYK